jgi:hypothetical protein
MPDGAAPQHESRVLPLAQHWERGPGGEGLFTGGTETQKGSVAALHASPRCTSIVNVPGPSIDHPGYVLSTSAPGAASSSQAFTVIASML